MKELGFKVRNLDFKLGALIFMTCLHVHKIKQILYPCHHLVTIWSTNFHNAQRYLHKVNGKYDQLFTIISAEILLHSLGYSFLTEDYILTHSARCCCHHKHQKLSARRLLCFGNTNVGDFALKVVVYWQQICRNLFLFLNCLIVSK